MLGALVKVYYGTVPYRTVPYGTVPYCTVQVRYGTVWYRIVPVRYGTVHQYRTGTVAYRIQYRTGQQASAP